MTATARPLTTSRLRTRAAAILAVLGVAVPLTVVASPAPASAAPEFGAPDEIAADYYGALLRHTRWVDTVWDNAAGVYQARDFNFAVVLGNAVLLTHGEYDETLAGTPEHVLRERTIATIEHYAGTNLLVSPGGTWGKRLFWDTTFQSYFLLAGHLMWDELSAATQENLMTIATGQSAYTADLDYGRDPLSGSWTADWPTGKYNGDTAQEEVGVYTQALAPGLAWAPNDPDAARWAEHLGDWGRNAAGQPTADLNNPAIVAGKAISTNTMQTIHDSYLVENHGSFGPHYQSDIWRSGARNAIHFLVNDQPLPEILTRQPNSAELWESIKLVMSDQGEPLMPMVADREFLYGRDVIPLAFLGQVLRDPDAVRAEANLAAALEDYQAYAPVDRLTKFSGEPKYEPEARAEIAISYLLHVEAAESEGGVVEPTASDEFFERLTGVRDFGATPGLTVQQSAKAWAGAASRTGFVKFPWVPEHDSWLFHISGGSEFLYPRTADTVDNRYTEVYTSPRDGFDGTASLFTIGNDYAGQVTLPTGAAIYATSGNGVGDGELSVRNLNMAGYNDLDGSRTYTTADGTATGSQPVEVEVDPVDARAARIDTLDFDPVSARYVRMQGEVGNPQYGYSMYAFHAFDSATGGTVDLAAGKTASASSQANSTDRAAQTVVDGNPNTRWAVATGERSNPNSWIQVDLGSSLTVDSVRLAWESSAGMRYRIETSEDGVAWSPQVTYDAGNPADVNAARVDTIELAPEGANSPGAVEARYVRMQGLQASPQYGYSLFHFRAFTPDGENVALGRPASASSVDGNFVASNVTDPGAGTRWAVARDQRVRPDSWVHVDLGVPTEISEVQLAWEVAAGRMFKIQTSLDGQTWTDAAKFRYSGDQVVESSGSWINVEDKGGFVVVGQTGPIIVDAVSDTRHVLRLLDADEGAQSPALIEMVPGSASETAAQAAVPRASTDHDDLMVSTLDGYVSVFNLSGEDAAASIRIPHEGSEISLFEGTQVLDENESTLEVEVPGGTAIVLAPRSFVAASAVPATGLTAHVTDARTVTLTSATPTEITVRNIETGEEEIVELGDDAQTATFAAARAFPDPDLALSRLTFPASVLPEGMTSPAAAVDGNASTSWLPGTSGRMVVDLGSSRGIGQVAAVWDGDTVPAAIVQTSSDGITFTDVGSVSTRGRISVIDVDASARYVALATQWSDGDANLEALRVLPPGIEQDEPVGIIQGELPQWRVQQAATGQLNALGSPAPTFTVTDGALPAGVTLDADTGTFGGIPTSAGDFRFTVTADNGVGDVMTRTFTGAVLAASSAGGGDGSDGGDGGDGNGAGNNGNIGDDADADGVADGPGTGVEGDDGELSNTGADVVGLVIAVAVLLALGSVFSVVGTRRRGRLGQ